MSSGELGKIVHDILVNIFNSNSSFNILVLAIEVFIKLEKGSSIFFIIQSGELLILGFEVKECIDADMELFRSAEFHLVRVFKGRELLVVGVEKGFFETLEINGNLNLDLLKNTVSGISSKVSGITFNLK